MVVLSAPQTLPNGLWGRKERKEEIDSLTLLGVEVEKESHGVVRVEVSGAEGDRGPEVGAGEPAKWRRMESD